MICFEKYEVTLHAVNNNMYNDYGKSRIHLQGRPL